MDNFLGNTNSKINRLNFPLNKSNQDSELKRYFKSSKISKKTKAQSHL